MEWLVNIFRAYPVIPIFLTVGLGCLLGKVSWKGVSLGSVTAVLLMGVGVGQMNIPIGEPLQSLAFLLFLFAIGYQCGPQFASALRGSGIRQIIFALIINLICFVTVVICARIMHYNAAVASGLYAGSQTISPVIGVAIDTINSLGLPEAQRREWVAIIPVCYAVTYLYGAIGAVWILGTLGPRMLGGLEKVRQQTRELEEQLSHSSLPADPALVDANQVIAFRAYKVVGSHFAEGLTVRQIEEHFRQQRRRLFVERIRTADGVIHDAAPGFKIHINDEIVLSGRHQYIVANDGWIGPEIDDAALCAFPVMRTRVMISHKVAGLTLDQLRSLPAMYGVIIESIKRDDGVDIPVLAQAKLQHGDILTIRGLPAEVREAIPELGVEERPTNQTDLIFLCLAIALGAFVGALTIHIGNVPISLSTSGGALLSGIFFGWLRTHYPAVGQIPAPALWFMNNVGLCLFIAVIGIQAGPTFMAGIQKVGIMLFVMGFVATTIPLILAIWIGDKIFKFHPAVNLGCCAGGRKTTPGIGAVTSALGSSVPALGYTITYAISNIVSIFLAVVLVLMFMY